MQNIISDIAWWKLADSLSLALVDIVGVHDCTYITPSEFNLDHDFFLAYSRRITVCLLLICKGFWGISLQPGVLASWGFHHWYLNTSCKVAELLEKFTENLCISLVNQL